MALSVQHSLHQPIKPIDWSDDEGLVLVDQRRLPVELVLVHPRTVAEVWDAIKGMVVRGAPAIGIAAAFGVYLAVRRSPASSPLPTPDAPRPGAAGARPAAAGAEQPAAGAPVGADAPGSPVGADAFLGEVGRAAAYLASSRPTAVNLFWALERMQARARAVVAAPPAELPAAATASPAALRVRWEAALLDEARQIMLEDRAMCRSIGEYGAALLRQLGAEAILTHCNAGSLATGQYGTALSPIYVLAESGRLVRVYADESRPLLQGARLTAWELRQAHIPVTLISDGMAATVLRKGWVQAVLTGSDRVAANGDVANKIGTYPLAVLAARHGVPFYVALPSSTFDPSLATGDAIPIEERDPDEVRRVGSQLIAPPDVDVFNPAFDVTPHELVTAFITEKGIVNPPFDRNLRLILGGAGEGGSAGDGAHVR